MLNILQLI